MQKSIKIKNKILYEDGVVIKLNVPVRKSKMKKPFIKIKSFKVEDFLPTTNVVPENIIECS